jgi:hypothetical protein
MILTQEYLKSRLRYDSETGHFYWIKTGKTAARFVGKLAGWQKSNGYICIAIDGKTYLAHRLAWLYIYGNWPHEIDHINNTRTDNRFINLRECTRSKNLMNSSDRFRRDGLPRGVYHHRKRFQAKIQKDYLGSFDTKEEAADAYQKERSIRYGEFS